MSHTTPPTDLIVLDGESLTPPLLVQISTGIVRVELSNAAWQRIAESRAVVDEMVQSNEVVYGVNTGFGEFAKVVIDSKQLAQLQENLIRSHAAGVGEPLSPARTRMLLALRINVLAKGHSGIRVETVQRCLAALNAQCLSVVPLQGTVGASGDLAQLSHLALGLMGEGEMWDPSGNGKRRPAAEVLQQCKCLPIELQAKEGLAMINGTQFMAALASEALERARMMALTGDIVAALTIEALRGTNVAFDASLHAARGHQGQQAVARRMRAVLHFPGQDESVISQSHANCGKVQDSYTLRCVPQVHGVVHDTLEFVRGLLTTELNAATDNPMVFAAPRSRLISGGNFHGEYVAKALDFLAIGAHEIANMSERRMERLCNPALSNGLPAFLVNNGGLNSGFMIPHCTAAALVSENKAPARASQALEAVHALVRQHVQPYDKDRIMHPDIEAVQKLVQSGQIWAAAEPFMKVL